MKIESEKLKRLMLFTITAFRRMEQEILAHIMVENALKKTLDLGKEMDEMLRKARSSEVLEKQLQEKYDKPLERFLATIDQAEIERQWSDLLKQWTPIGPIN